MAEKGDVIRVNRAPVLTLRAATVAERLGHDADAAITLGRAVAGSSARVKARAIGGRAPGDGGLGGRSAARGAEPDRPLLYERLRPEVPTGAAGWGKKGSLDLKLIENARP